MRSLALATPREKQPHRQSHMEYMNPPMYCISVIRRHIISICRRNG